MTSDRRLVAFGIAVGFLVLAGWELVSPHYDYWGIDIELYVRGAQRFLATGSPYNPYQLSGQPYPIGGDVFLYPPPMLTLILPFVWVPRLLWWAAMPTPLPFRSSRLATVTRRASSSAVGTLFQQSWKRL